MKENEIYNFLVRSAKDSKHSEYYKLIVEYADRHPSYLGFLVDMKFKNEMELENYYENYYD